jgi:hypothetical protein
MTRLRRPPPLLVAFALAGLVVLVFSVLIPRLPTRTLEVRVDLESSAGSNVALFLNDFREPPHVAPLQPGTRNVYAFELSEGDIDVIRIDVGDALGADLRYYGVKVLDSDGKVRADYPAFDLASWHLLFATAEGVENGAFRATGTGAGPSLTGLREVSAASALPWPLEPVVGSLSEPEGLLRAALVALGLGAALLGLMSPKGRWTLALGALAGLAAVFALDLTLRNPRGLASASSELGRATYVGLSQPTNVLAIWTLYGYAIVLAVAATLLAWWRRGARWSTQSAVAASSPRAGRLGLVVAAIAALAAVALCVPDLEVALLEATEGLYPAGWDAENLLVWSELAARGLTPMADFWYPYGNFVVFDSGLVTGPVAYGAYQFAFLAAFGWIFWIAATRRLLASSLALLALLAIQAIVGEFFRYGLGLAIALAYTCIDVDGPPQLRLASRLVFGSLAVLGLFLDPLLVAHAAVGVAVMLAVDMWRGRRRGLRWWARRLGADFALPAAGLVAAVLVAAVRGQLDGALDLYLSLQGSTIYSAEPTRLMRGLRSALDPVVLAVWLPSVLVAVGLFARLTTPNAVLRHGLASRLLVIGAAAAPLLLKHAVRPAPTQILLFPAIALVIVLIWASAWRRAWPAVGLLGGLGVSVALAYPGPDLVVESIKDLPSRVAYDVTLPFDDDKLDRARADRFSDERFASFPQELAVASDLRARPELDDDTVLFVLGDAPVLYLLLGQRPPWQIVPYDTSPIAEQRNVIDTLEKEAPGVVVVDRTSQVFDGIPHDTRIPLVFQYVIEHYDLDRSVGPYDVLVRRDPDPEQSAAYWTDLLGGDVELGSTPSVSSYDQLERCDAETEECGAFLVVEPPASGAEGPVDVPLLVAGKPIFVSFTADGARRYVVPLARTWPWALSTDIRLAGEPTSGWRAHIVRGEQAPDALY